MRRLALMTVGFIVVLNVAPTVLPLEATVVGFVAFVGFLVWWVWPR